MKSKHLETFCKGHLVYKHAKLTLKNLGTFKKYIQVHNIGTIRHFYISR